MPLNARKRYLIIGSKATEKYAWAAAEIPYA